MFCDHLFSLLAFQYVSFASQKSGLIIFHTQVIEFSLFGHIDIHYFQGVLDKGLFDLKIQRSVSCETGSVVYFEKDGFTIAFEHDIKS